MKENLKRIINFAVKDFSRNKGISVAAVFVLTITIMLVTGLVFFQVMTSYLTSQVQNKIDITAYFKSGTAEQDILNAKTELTKMQPSIKDIQYVSQDQALATFNTTHQSDAVLSQALQDVGVNPFLPSLNITTNGDPAQYAQIANILQTADFNQLIDSVDYSQKKDIIEKVYSITSKVNIFGIALGIILLCVAAVVVYNTIKLAVESSKDEISTMRVVGATDQFIRGPFIIQGAIYGLIAFAICFVISALFAFALSSQMSVVLPGFNMAGYFLGYWWALALIQLFFGVGVGVISSFVVVKKYLDI